MCNLSGTYEPWPDLCYVAQYNEAYVISCNQYLHKFTFDEYVIIVHFDNTDNNHKKIWIIYCINDSTIWIVWENEMKWIGF